MGGGEIESFSERQREFGILSMANVNGQVMGHLNFVLDNDYSLYIHCTMRDINSGYWKNNARVTFCIIGGVKCYLDALRQNMRVWYWKAKPISILVKKRWWKPFICWWINYLWSTRKLVINIAKNHSVG